MVVRAFQINPTSSRAMPFIDVTNSTKWYYNYVLQASRANIVSNSVGIEFKPDQGITREQALVILSKAIQYSGITLDSNGPALSAFSDANNVTISFRSAIESLTKGKIVLGSNNKLNPKQITTRAEAALLVYRAAIKLPQ
jgi:hypothetical protein